MRKRVAEQLNDLSDVASKASRLLPVGVGNVLYPKLNDWEAVSLDAMLMYIAKTANEIRLQMVSGIANGSD